jgi:signal transduction histidine kinase
MSSVLSHRHPRDSESASTGDVPTRGETVSATWQPLGRARAAWSGAQALDRWLITITILLGALTVAAIIALGHHVHAQAPALDIVVDTATTGITASVAALSWVRYRETANGDSLFRTSSFVVFMAANAYSLLLVILPADLLAGPVLIGDGPAPLWVTTFGRGLAALLLVLPLVPAAVRPAMRHPRATVALPTVILLASVPIAQALAPVLPALSDMFELHTADPIMLPASTPIGTIVQSTIAALCFGGAAAARRSALRTGSAGDRYMAAALLFAAFSQVMLAAYPGTFPGLVGLADLLRLAFDMTLLLAVQAEASSMLRRLQTAAIEHEQLRRTEADRSAIEERARLARELHDGLAQDLWLAKLKASRLAVLSEGRPDEAKLCEEVQGAIDAGLTEAMQAVAALRSATDGRALAHVLAAYIDDYADRFGLRVDLTIDPDLPRLPARTEAELLRIAQEALANVRRHADATVVRITLSVDDDGVTLSIRDNGRGFDVDLVDQQDYGLAGMRERAALIGASLTIESQRSEGTRVAVVVPRPGAVDRLSGDAVRPPTVRSTPADEPPLEALA